MSNWQEFSAKTVDEALDTDEVNEELEASQEVSE